ncbi:DMT family transporter [Streptomyces solicathayae]|uniref:DMT family transporter n=1 Tax=Streptomyces solicathayae TaxID=3081768 RepID=A0ABZ0LMR2_9ACTN|nr:DMT family transporter [Streptomyces sp. HUAS YS2]WOX20754.1 DMT family transporter [Streptomyces sp. HUAS YS2]
MSPLLLSVLLALVSAVAYAAAAIVQERVAASSPGHVYAPLRSPAWWGSVALNCLGGLLHVAALAYGPLSVVQPLGALTIVFALPMAALFVGRRAGRTAWRGALMATVGLAGLLSLTGGADSQAPAGGERLALAGVAAGVVAVLVVVSGRIRRPVARGVVLAGAAGVSFGLASVFTKTVAEDWTSSAPLAEWPSALATAGFAVAGLLLSQASYRGAGLAAPLATVTVVNPVVAAAVGLSLFGETFRYGAVGAALALLAGAVAAGGLVLLTLGRTADDLVPEPTGRESAGRGVSDRDAAPAEVGERVDVGAVTGPRPHLEVEMRSRAVAGRS